MSSFSRGWTALAHHQGLLSHATCAPCLRPAAARTGTLDTLLVLRSQLLRPSAGARSGFSSFARAQAKTGHHPPKPKSGTPPPPPARSATVVRAAAAAAAHKAAQAGASTAAAAASAATAAGVARTFAEQLGRRAAPTLLYAAPSHFWFRLSCISAGTFCLGYTVLNYWNVYVRPPEGLAWWVPHAFAVIFVVMAGLGFYFIMGGSRIVRVIQAVPADRLEALAGPGTAARAAKAAAEAGVGAAGRTGPAPVYLEVEIGRMLPLLPARKLYVAPTQVVLPARLAVFGLSGGSDQHGAAAAGTVNTAEPASGVHVPAGSSTGYERMMARRAEEARQKKAREYEMNHLMTAPFRHAAQGARTAWEGISRAFSRDGFVKVRVDGAVYKLDVSGGWALDRGRALDRLVSIQEGAF